MKTLSQTISRFTYVCKYMGKQPKESDLVERFRTANKKYDNICDDSISVSGSSISVNGELKISVKLAEKPLINKMEALVVVNNLNEDNSDLSEGLHNQKAYELLNEKLNNNKVLVSGKTYESLVSSNIEKFGLQLEPKNILVFDSSVNNISMLNHKSIESYLAENKVLLYGSDLIEDLSDYIDNVTVIKSSVTPLQKGRKDVLVLSSKFEKEITNLFVASENGVAAFHKTFKNVNKKSTNKISESLTKQLLLNYYLNM